MIERMRAVILAMLALACLAWAGTASAHLTPNSEITLDMSPGGMRANIIIPQSEYAFATDNPVTNDAPSHQKARDYLRAKFRVLDGDGRAWAMEYRTVEFAQIAGPPDLHAVVDLAPPPGAADRRFTVEWTAVIEDVPSHMAMLVVGTDLAGADGASGERELLGTFVNGDTRIAVERGEGTGWRVFANSVHLGMRHIAEGYDHLLFLLALLLPAPLLARGGHWREPRQHRATIVLLGAIVTAFTIGHSLTLVLATIFGFALPVAPVEIGIALSVLISAIHAIRPIFPGREPWVAAVFGLIHGLAFATLVSGYSLSTEGRGLALLGFNLGIEAIQIAIVLACLPALLFAAHRVAYRYIRIGLAAFTAVAAMAWLIERATDSTNQVAALAETVLPMMAYAIAASSLLIMVAWIVRRFSQGAARPA